jgi:hypothetical protein
MASPKKPAAKKAAPDASKSQSDVAKALLEKVRGADQAGKPGAGGPPKQGFTPKGGFNVKNQVKGGSGPRRTQGKGG